MNTYALGIQETHGDNNLWIKVDAADNETALGSFAVTLKAQVEKGFAVADIIFDIKAYGIKILGIFVDTVPDVDHTPHLFIQSDASVALYDKETGDHLVTRGVESWARIYGVTVTVPEHGIPVS